MEKIKNYSHDTLIIGAGGAGLASALFLSDAMPNIKIAILCKTYVMGSHTTSAKGGINATLGNITHDEIAWHVYDTIQSGKGLCDEIPTKYMCENAPWAIEYLAKIGVNFDKAPNNKINQRVYGGQTLNFGKGGLANRACFVGDFTGNAIMSALFSEIKKRQNIVIYNYRQVVDFEKSSQTSIAYNMENGTIETFQAGNTIFATGGFSQIYQTNSSSHLCTGCGHRVLFENGAILKDIEFVQFHPTGLANNGMLISEACRSEGAFLINSKGERFMEKYSPMLELASRDVIAKSICSEAKNGGVYLDLRHIDGEIIKTKLLSSYTAAKHFGKTDITTTPLQIYPTAHYNMGGISVNEKYQISDNIYAIGELACASVHGANRLGCNSLLELFTSAKICVENIAKNFTKFNGETSHKANEKIAKLQNVNSKIEYEEIIEIQKQIKKIMNENASVVKNHNLLKTALTQIEAIYDEISKLNNFAGIKYDSNFITLYETQSLVKMAKAVLVGAISRKHSIGSHFIEDFPNTIENPQHSNISGNFTITYTSPY